MTNDTHVTKREKRVRIPAAVYLIILVMGCVPAILIRCWQLSVATNLETGYYNGPELYNTILFGIIVGLPVLLTMLSLVDRTRYQVTLFDHNMVLIRFMALCSAILFIVYGSAILYRTFSAQVEISAMDLVMMLFVFLAAIGFLYLIWRVKQETSGISDIMLCLPCLWSCILLLSMLLQHVVVMTITENIINILWISSLCVFLLNVAKIVSDTAQYSSDRWLIISGSFSILTGLCATLPPFFLWWTTGQKYTSEHVLTATLLDFIVLLFVIVFYAQYLIIRKKAAATVNK